MNPYELMFIVHPNEDEGEGIDAHIERVGRLIVDHGGEVTGVDKWGKRRFAYVVDDLAEGHYVVMTFKASASLVDEVGRILRLTDLIVRHLIVRLDEDVAPAELSVDAEEDQSSEPGEADGSDTADEASEAEADVAAASAETPESDDGGENADEASDAEDTPEVTPVENG